MSGVVVSGLYMLFWGLCLVAKNAMLGVVLSGLCMSCWALCIVAYTCHVGACGHWPIRTLFLILCIHRLLIFKFCFFRETYKGSHAADYIYINFNNIKQCSKS
jgi:hypothetical protein